ncbi:MAG: hypothetical protein DLM50_06920 [Candidatus Meridianibacter frigidus]|nr:MAG: hypothetical protein DLM50_06920 [Candidatus Eremiobacteraeota bacterium]
MLTALDWLSAGVGLFLIWLCLRDVFQSVIVPRAVDRRLRISAFLSGQLWRVWRRRAGSIQDDDRREDFLGAFAPSLLVILFASWAFTLIFGYGLIFVALRDQLNPPATFWKALYFAGTSFLTIGFGDVVGSTGIARLVSIAAGASGLAVVAVVTAFLFSVFAAFQRREVFVVNVSAHSGAPPSGIGLLTTYGEGQMIEELSSLFAAGQQWAAEVMESHLAYPVLAFFRSSHDYESWVGALGTLLDASALILSATEGNAARGQAQVMYELGRHLTHDFARYFRLRLRDGPGIERFEFSGALARLEQVGFPIRDEDTAWRKFAAVRGTYAPALAAMASFWNIPPLQWIGDRSSIVEQHLQAAAVR